MFPQRQETIFKLTHEKKFSCVRCVDIRGKIQKDRRQVGRLLVYGSYNKLTNSLLLSTTLPKHYFGSKVPRFVTSHLMLHPSLTGGDVKTQKRALSVPLSVHYWQTYLSVVTSHCGARRVADEEDAPWLTDVSGAEVRWCRFKCLLFPSCSVFHDSLTLETIQSYYKTLTPVRFHILAPSGGESVQWEAKNIWEIFQQQPDWTGGE